MKYQYAKLHKVIGSKDWSWKYLVLDTWLPEIVAILFSVACFIAICAILIAYNEESQPELRYGLSLNAIVSALATGCKSSLTFVIGEAMGQLKWVWFYTKPKKLLDIQTLDSASRGPLGSIASLFQKTRRSLASIGAAVIILLLVFDPFIQQIISYPTRLTDKHRSTSIAIAKRLDYFAPSIDWKFIYSSGLWSEDTLLSPSCSTGNCTWSNFQSSGMCSQCTDITESMDLKCEQTGSDSFFLPEDAISVQALNATCQLSPPQGNSTQFDVRFQFSSSPSTPIANSIAYESIGTSWHIFSAYSKDMNIRYPETQTQPFTWPGDPLMVIGYAEIGYDQDFLNSDFVKGIRVDKVAECSLELCLLENKLSVRNGSPDLITSALDYGRLFWENSSVPSFSGQTLCWKPTDSPPDITFEDSIIPGTQDAQLSRVPFAFCGVSATIKLYEDVFVGVVHNGFTLDSNGTSSDPPDGDHNALRISSVGLDVIMSNVAKHINKEALSLNGSDVNGTALAVEVFVEVQWVWLILPIILVVSGTIFVTMVIVGNRRSGAGLWKSSVLAFFYHGLHDIDRDDSMTTSLMEKKAEGLVVRLQEPGDNQNLVLRRKKGSV